MIYLIGFIVILVCIYLYWRFFFFFRDPDRVPPSGNNIVSPADGTVVYVKTVEDDELPISIKAKKEIKLDEVFGLDLLKNEKKFLIGIFMHPTSVHVNRSPIEGRIDKILYLKNNNLPMTIMWWRVLLGIKPYEYYSKHVFKNERNTILFNGEIPVLITQIADIYVNRIDCWVKEGQDVKKGERVGMIKMGSQVDMIFPQEKISKVLVSPGQKVRAGETVIATIE